MELNQIKDLLSSINGCTFASLDACTEPTPGVRKVTTNERVILFTNKVQESGYANMVRRRLEQAGKNPDDFVLSDLPWGERVPETPLIYHAGRHYLQTVLLHPGEEKCFIGKHEVSCKTMFPNKGTNQGLSDDSEVVVRTYKLENITAIRLLGEEVVAPKRKILSLKH